jgi:hypothetical protein
MGCSTPLGGGPAHVAACAILAGGRPDPQALAVWAANSALVAPDELHFEGPVGGPFQPPHEFPTLLNTGAVDSMWSPADRLRLQDSAAGTLGPQAGVDLALSRDPVRHRKPFRSPAFAASAVNPSPHAGLGMTDE